jgi:hypothetical protein
MSDDSANANDARGSFASERASQWVVIPNWDRFQHYKDRDPRWIKDYVSQLDDPDWSNLTLAQRGLLQTLRLMYAAGDGRLNYSHAIDASNSRSGYVHAIFESLNHAGLVALVHSRPLALARSREKRREEKNEKPDRASAQDQKPTAKPTRPERRRANSDGGLEPIAVDDDMLRLAREWLAEHGGQATNDDVDDVDDLERPF